MKLNGKIVNVPNLKIIPIIRDDQTIILKVSPLKSFDDFEKICPIPDPPVREIPGKGIVPMVESKEYKILLENRNRYMIEYMVLKSLEATENLTWDTVDLNDPSTYVNYTNELIEAGFTTIEITRIVKAVMSANSLDEDAIQKARDDFLAGNQQAEVPE
jgi:hypothetical protein